MADPISIIGLLSTAATLTKTVLDYASSVKDAPSNLEDLKRELASLHNAFALLSQLLDSQNHNEGFEEVSALYETAAVRSIPRAFLRY